MRSIAGSLWMLGGVLAATACAQGAATGALGQDSNNTNEAEEAGQAQPDAGRPEAGAKDAGVKPTDSGGQKQDAAGGPGKPDAGPARDAAVTPPDPDGCAEICNHNLQNDARSCATPVTIGRKAALADDFVYNGDTRGDGNKQDLTFINCADGNADNFFRIYLYKGDRITVGLSTAEYDPVVVLTQGACTNPDAAACRDQGLDGESELMTVAIDENGWHHVVTDGPFGSTAPEGQGRYTLSVKIDNSQSAAPGQCKCP